MKIKTLEIPLDVEVDYNRDGVIQLIPHSQKAVDRIEKMSTLEQYQFAVAYFVRKAEDENK